jgi:hypothetical protein
MPYGRICGWNRPFGRMSKSVFLWFPENFDWCCNKIMSRFGVVFEKWINIKIVDLTVQ